MTLTEKIKSKALELGYIDVGVCSADEFTEYIDELGSRTDTYDFYISNARSPLTGAAPKKTNPEAKSIISLAYGFSHIAFPEKLIGKVGRAYQARCYNPREKTMNGARIGLFKEFLKDNGINVCKGTTVPDRLAAARAGIATYGKNNFAYVKGTGSFVILTSVVVDRELDYDEPTIKRQCPQDCHICIDSCPTGAIEAPGVLNPRKCLAFNNWFTQENWLPPNNDGSPITHIPHDIRDKMGLRIHGCDVCQEVCPRNKAVLSKACVKDNFLELTAEKFDLAKVLNMDDEYYEEVVWPIMYNYIRGIRYFRRNAAIAIGNSRDEKYVPDLITAAQDSDPLIREYAVWALGKIGGIEAINYLNELNKTENDSAVRAEIKLALEKNR